MCRAPNWRKILARAAKFLLPCDRWCLRLFVGSDIGRNNDNVIAAECYKADDITGPIASLRLLRNSLNANAVSAINSIAMPSRPSFSRTEGW